MGRRRRAAAGPPGGAAPGAPGSRRRRSSRAAPNAGVHNGALSWLRCLEHSTEHSMEHYAAWSAAQVASSQYAAWPSPTPAAPEPGGCALPRTGADQGTSPNTSSSLISSSGNMPRYDFRHRRLPQLRAFPEGLAPRCGGGGCAGVSELRPFWAERRPDAGALVSARARAMRAQAPNCWGPLRAPLRRAQPCFRLLPAVCVPTNPVEPPTPPSKLPLRLPWPPPFRAHCARCSGSRNFAAAWRQ
eukprot:gene14951-biopygen7489